MNVKETTCQWSHLPSRFWFPSLPQKFCTSSSFISLDPGRSRIRPIRSLYVCLHFHNHCVHDGQNLRTRRLLNWKLHFPFSDLSSSTFVHVDVLAKAWEWRFC
ncbi:hypothetical protein OWV82_012331 [Melia azedarach]|uniref:Uncharacterized protein n=1 Tax=Melia azedarach TaxID=155640 RepID=A0ACC1Y137_MELAZ|nr:hypothetical protein OWV82_012331 [Melia azedarach]